MDQLTVATHEQKLRLWISRIQECRSSGITVEAWCKQHGFSSKNYYYWMRKIKREAFEALPAILFDAYRGWIKNHSLFTKFA